MPSSTKAIFVELRFQLSGTPLRFFLAPYYFLAQWALKYSVGKSPVVEAAFLVGGVPRGKCRYGMSDIDFVIVVPDGMIDHPLTEGLLQRLTWLRKVFPMLSRESESSVLARTEFEMMKETTHPFLFSLPNRIKVLVRRVDISLKQNYLREHEFSLLRYLWLKILLSRDTSHRLQEQHLLRGIESDLEEVGGRLEIVSSGNKSVFQKFLDVFAAVAPEGLGSSFLPGAGEIPHFLYFESSAIHALWAEQNLPSRIRYQRVSQEKGAEALESSLNSPDCDAVFFETFGLPTKITGDFTVFRKSTHPLTFRALDNGEKKLSAELIPDWLLRRNVVFFRRFHPDWREVFSFDGDRLKFAVPILFFWKKILGDELAAESLTETMAEIERDLGNHKRTKAYLEAAALLRGVKRKLTPLRVSVIVPTRNRHRLLKRTLNSVLTQNRRADEIIVVDNASTDCTADLVHEFQRRHACLKYVRESRVSVTFARNRGLEETGGRSEVVLFIDDDCEAHPDWLEEMVLPFEYDDNIASVGGDVDYDRRDSNIFGDYYRHFKQVSAANL